MSTRIVIFLFFLVAGQLNAQLPQCNMYAFDLSQSDSKYQLENAKFLTAFNKDGYNNQPAFFGDDVVYFTTNYYSDEQTEIAKFDFSNEVMTRITYTEESEYSPTVVPGSTEFSCVRVELNNEVQSLSVYPEDGIGYPKRYMHNTSNIGYHNWIDENTLALFLVEDPHHNLAIADADSERRKIILDKIGRCLKVNAQNELLFVHKIGEDNWYIKSYDNKANKSTVIVKTRPGSEDFELMDDGSILIGSGSILYRYDPKLRSKGWQAITDLNDHGIHYISRIIIRNKRLIIVDQKPDKS